MKFSETAYEYFYRRRKLEAESRRIRFDNVRIVSVGNLTTGGTGKTPATQWLARRLQNENLKTVIVGRGYGGEYSERGAIISDGEKIFLSAQQAGDEAILHARNLPGTPIAIGRDRVKAVELAVEKFSPDVIVLDDGFQYWSLARDFDLVLLDARKPFGNEKLLPAGRLREPMKELNRADGVLLTRADLAGDNELQTAIDKVKKLASAPIFQAAHQPVALRDEKSGARVELSTLQSQRVAAIGALANNENFFASLQALGAQVVSTLARRDHHAWRENEIRDFVDESVERKSANIVMTTEKDAVKIVPNWCALPLYSLLIEMKIENENDFWDLIRMKIEP